MLNIQDYFKVNPETGVSQKCCCGYSRNSLALYIQELRPDNKKINES